MTKVLIVAGSELTAVLERTVVWRSDVQRLFAPDLAGAFEAACSALPKLVILDGAPQDQVVEILRRFRADGLTRKMSLAWCLLMPLMKMIQRHGPRYRMDSSNFPPVNGSHPLGWCACSAF